MSKPITHAIINVKKEILDRLEDVRVLPYQSGAGAIFVVAAIESSHEDKKVSTMFLDEIMFQLDTLAKHPAPEKDAEPRFEDAMQSLNDHLKIWLNAHPNAIDIARSSILITSLTGATVLITGFGQIASMYLHAKGSGDEAHDLVRDIRREPVSSSDKLFKTVMMGVFEPGDRAFLGNAATLRQLPKEELAEWLSTLPAKSAAEKIALHSANASETVMGFVLKSAEQLPAAGFSAKTSVDELQRSQARTEHVLTSSPRSSRELARNLGKWTLAMLANGTALLLACLISLLSVLFGSLKTVFMLAFGPGHRERAKKSFHELLAKCRERIAAKNSAMSWPMRIVFLLLVVLIVWGAIAASRAWSTKRVVAEQAAHAAVIAEITSLEGDAEAKLIYNDDAGTKASLDAAQAKMDANPWLASNPANGNFVIKMADMRKQLRKEFTLSVQPTWSLPSAGMRLGLLGGDNKVSVITAKGELVVNGGASIATTLAPHFAWFGLGALYAMDSNGTVSSIATDGSVKTLQGVLPNTLADATMYSGRIYAIQPSTASIVRADPVTGGFATAKTWQKGEVKALANAKGIAIDSDVYVVTNTDVLKFTKNIEVNFTLGAIDPAPTELTRIWTSEKSNFLYLLESSKHRIVVVDKGNGAYVKQYLFDGTEGVTDFLVNESAKTITLMAGTQILTGGM